MLLQLRGKELHSHGRSIPTVPVDAPSPALNTSTLVNARAGTYAIHRLQNGRTDDRLYQAVLLLGAWEGVHKNGGSVPTLSAEHQRAERLIIGSKSERSPMLRAYRVAVSRRSTPAITARAFAKSAGMSQVVP